MTALRRCPLCYRWVVLQYDGFSCDDAVHSMLFEHVASHYSTSGPVRREVRDGETVIIVETPKESS